MFIIKALYFFLPAYLANSTPVIIRKWDFLSYPLDFGYKFRGRRIFGDHKTVRGFLFGSLAAVMIYLIQTYLFNHSEFIRSISLFDYNQIHCSYGFLLGAGSLAGDFIESFFKRQMGIKSGEMLWFFDQTDYVFGAILFAAPLFFPGLNIFVTLLIISGLLSFLSHRLAYLLKMIDTKS